MPRGKRTSLPKQVLWGELCAQIKLPINPDWYSSGSNVSGEAFEAALRKIAQKTGIPPSSLSDREQHIWRMLHKSEDAILSAIQSINDPTAVYRLETFLFLFLNAWELLLKSKIVKDKGLLAIREREHKTITITKAIEDVFISKKDPIRSNLEMINELRNDAAHYVIPIVPADALVVFQAGIRNYEKKLQEWFEKSLSDKLPYGMMFLISNIDATIFDMDKALLDRRLNKETAQILKNWGNSFREKLDAIEANNVVNFAIPLKFGLSITKNIEKAEILASIDKSNYDNAMFVVKQQDITDLYPLSYEELWEKIKSQRPRCTKKQFQYHIKEKQLKGNPKYSEYNFRTKKQKLDYQKTKKIPTGTPCLYNNDAFYFLLSVITI
jgi:hypothetical protein